MRNNSLKLPEREEGLERVTKSRNILLKSSKEKIENLNLRIIKSKQVEPKSATALNRNKSKSSNPQIQALFPSENFKNKTIHSPMLKKSNHSKKLNHPSSNSSILSSKNNKSVKFKEVKNHRQKDNIQVVSKGLSFNLIFLTSILFVFISAICLLHVLYFCIYYPKTVRIENYIKGYVLGIETWNSITLAYTSLYSAIAWNNTSPFWGMSAIDSFRIHTDYIRENVIMNMTILVEQDLGDLSDNYTSLLLKVRNSPHSSLTLFKN